MGKFSKISLGKFSCKAQNFEFIHYLNGWVALLLHTMQLHNLMGEFKNPLKFPCQKLMSYAWYFFQYFHRVDEIMIALKYSNKIP